jgi:hypothetical protein
VQGTRAEVPRSADGAAVARTSAHRVIFICCETKIWMKCSRSSRLVAISGPKSSRTGNNPILLHFGDARVLSEAVFTRFFEPALFRNKNDLNCLPT